MERELAQALAQAQAREAQGNGTQAPGGADARVAELEAEGAALREAVARAEERWQAASRNMTALSKEAADARARLAAAGNVTVALQAAPPPPPNPPRTKWTRRVPHPVLNGHAA